MNPINLTDKSGTDVSNFASLVTKKLDTNADFPSKNNAFLYVFRDRWGLWKSGKNKYLRRSWTQEPLMISLDFLALLSNRKAPTKAH